MAFVVFLRASSNRRTTTSHLVVLQICLEPCLICSENNVRPAAFSTASTTNGIRSLASGSAKVRTWDNEAFERGRVGDNGVGENKGTR